MKQREKLLKIMLDNKEHKVWYAKDFQHGANFIGYEATARMSEIADIYREFVEVGKDGRFRTLSINWEKEEEINKVKELLDELEKIENEK